MSSKLQECVFIQLHKASLDKQAGGRGRLCWRKGGWVTGNPAHCLSHALKFSPLEPPTPQHREREAGRNGAGPADTTAVTYCAHTVDYKTFTWSSLHMIYWKVWIVFFWCLNAVIGENALQSKITELWQLPVYKGMSLKYVRIKAFPWLFKKFLLTSRK